MFGFRWGPSMLLLMVVVVVATFVGGTYAATTGAGRAFSTTHQHHSSLEDLQLPVKRSSAHLDHVNNFNNLNAANHKAQLKDGFVSMTIDRQTISDPEDAWVQVSWHGAKFSKAKDWIGLFPCSDTACDDAFFGTAPVSFKYTNEDHRRAVPSGSLRFWVQLRPGVSRFRFALVSSPDPFPVLLATSEIVSFTEHLAFAPMHVRLSLASTSSSESNTARFQSGRAAAGVERGSAVRTRTDNTAMRVMWAQRKVLCDHPPQVRYAVKGTGVLTTKSAFRGGRRHVSHAERAYGVKREWMCDQDVAPAGKQGWINQAIQLEAVMRGLVPGEWYVYTVGDDVHGWTPDRYFQAPPAWFKDSLQGKEMSDSLSDVVHVPNSNSGEPILSISVFGDMGQSMNEVDGSQQHSWDFHNRGEMPAPNTTRLLAALVDKQKSSLVFHFGDISYAVGYESEWDNFLHQIEPVSARVPWMTGIGNHEQGYSGSFVQGSDSGGECGFAYMSRFPFASTAASSSSSSSSHVSSSGSVDTDTIGGPRCVVDSGAQYSWASESRKDRPWYSFQHGLAHITVMSTEHPFAPGTPQYEWLANDLLHNVDRTRTPWLIFSGHRPMYVDSVWDGDVGVGRDIARHIEPLLIQAKVELGLWGHDHSYQRTCHVRDAKCYDTDGEGQAYKGPVHLVVGTAGYSATKLPKKSTSEIFLKTSDKHWGLVQLNFFNATHLQTAFIDNEDGSILDESWIVRQQDRHAGPAAPSASIE